MSTTSPGTQDDSNWHATCSDLSVNVTVGDHQLFDASSSAVKPQIKLEVLTARQVNRVIMFNVFAWSLVMLVIIGRIASDYADRLVLRPVKMPNGRVKTLRFVIGKHWGCWSQLICSLAFCLVAYALAVVFSIRLFRGRKKYKITAGQKMTLLMVTSLAFSMSPVLIIVMMHDLCWLDSDAMRPNPGALNAKSWFIGVLGLATLSRMLFFSASSILYTWGVSHILGEPEVMATKRERTRFYLQKFLPLLFYMLLRLYCFFVENAVPGYLPFTSLLGMVLNFSTMETWYPRVVGIVSAITIAELAFVVVIALRMRTTAKILRRCNYIETRMRQVSFRFLIWTTILPLLVFYLYQCIDRLFSTNYTILALWLRDPSVGGKIHWLNTSSWVERDILLVCQAVVIAYAHLPIDSEGFIGWFKSSGTGQEDTQDNSLEVQPISLSLTEDQLDEGPNSLNTTSSARQCVLPTHILLFNFAWLAYVFDKDNHGSIIPADAEFTVKCHIKHKETDTSLLIANFPDRIVLAFKGTTTMKNVATDLKVVTVPLLSAFPTCEHTREKLHQERNWRSAKVHKGFVTAYSAVSKRVLNELRELLAEGPKPILCTGHSLGGALATFCSLDICTSLSISPNEMVVSTFGSPRCGNVNWRALYDQHIKAHWRFAIDNDIVTMLPRSFTYDHVGKQVLLKAGGDLFLDPSGIEGSVFGVKGASVKNHKKSAYQIYLDAFCKKYLFNFEPLFWKNTTMKTEGTANGKSNFNTASFMNVMEALEEQPAFQAKQ